MRRDAINLKKGGERKNGRDALYQAYNCDLRVYVCVREGMKQKHKRDDALESGSRARGRAGARVAVVCASPITYPLSCVYK